MTEAELDKLLQPYKDSNGNVKPKDVYRAILSFYTDKWQPIETAPNSMEVLVCGTKFKREHRAEYDEWPEGHSYLFLAGKEEGSDCFYTSITSGEFLELKPTDWQPLPEPPKKRGKYDHRNK